MVENDGVKRTSSVVASANDRKLDLTSGREPIIDHAPLPFHVKPWLSSGALRPLSTKRNPDMPNSPGVEDSGGNAFRGFVIGDVSVG